MSTLSRQNSTFPTIRERARISRTMSDPKFKNGMWPQAVTG
ncbi:hypothetical protein [Lentzea alba]|nr:hypothetical protein [Lentzea alba]